MATTRGSMLTKKGKVGGMLVRNTVLRCAAARFWKGKKREVFFIKFILVSSYMKGHGPMMHDLQVQGARF